RDAAVRPRRLDPRGEVLPHAVQEGVDRHEPTRRPRDGTELTWLPARRIRERRGERLVVRPDHGWLRGAASDQRRGGDREEPRRPPHDLLLGWQRRGVVERLAKPC